MRFDEYNRQVFAAWKTHRCPVPGLPGSELFPLLLPEQSEGVRIVYSGINPSFRLDAVNRFASESGCPIGHFEWSADFDEQDWHERQEPLRRFEALAREQYKPYFKPFWDLSGDIGLKRSDSVHVDVLPLRATRQVQLISALKHLGGDRNVQLFIAKLISIYAETLKALKPQVVLVANATAAKWLRSRLTLVPGDERRTYSWSETPDTTFVLSSQLSGGALDEFGRDRLVADLRWILRGRGPRL